MKLKKISINKNSRLCMILASYVLSIVSIPTHNLTSIGWERWAIGVSVLTLIVFGTCNSDGSSFAESLRNTDRALNAQNAGNKDKTGYKVKVIDALPLLLLASIGIFTLLTKLA